MNRSAPGRAPWSNGDVVRLAAGVMAGAVVCGVAWIGASGHAELSDQTGWVAVGVAGFLLAVAGQAQWLLRGRRAVNTQAARVMTGVAAVTPAGGRPAPAVAAERLVAAEGLRHFHRPDCPIAAGHGWVPVSRSAHEAARRTACGICRP